MSSIQDILDYQAKISFKKAFGKEYLPAQIGHKIIEITSQTTDLSDVDLVLVGCGEFRGQYIDGSYQDGPDKVRKELYELYDWHEHLKIADFGNIIEGATLNDTKAALRTVLSELNDMGKKVLVLGGAHDLTLQQYEVFKQAGELIDLSVIDMLVDINTHTQSQCDSYLMDALTSTSNHVRHFNLIGFQSYFVNPHLIETFDKLRFDCIRVGKARENLNEIEPMLRNSSVISLDINAIRSSDAPANKLASPNGFYGDEICKISQFAGMSTQMRSFGIYGYQPHLDTESITAKLLAQMIWYFVDGLSIQAGESDISNASQFLEYQIPFTDTNILFRKSKKTNRWWMQLSNGRFIPCSYNDYVSASQNEIPERWLRELERLI